MRIVLVLVFVSALALTWAQDSSDRGAAVSESTITEKTNTDKKSGVKGVPVPGPASPKPFLGFGGDWPFKFDSGKAKEEFEDFKGLLSSAGSIWNTIAGFIGMIDSSLSGKGKKNTKTVTADPNLGEY